MQGVNIWKRLIHKIREHVCRNTCIRYSLIIKACLGIVFHGKKHAFNPSVNMFHLEDFKEMFLNATDDVPDLTPIPFSLIFLLASHFLRDIQIVIESIVDFQYLIKNILCSILPYSQYCDLIFSIYLMHCHVVFMHYFHKLAPFYGRPPIKHNRNYAHRVSYETCAILSAKICEHHHSTDHSSINLVRRYRNKPC